MKVKDFIEELRQQNPEAFVLNAEGHAVKIKQGSIHYLTLNGESTESKVKEIYIV